MASLADRVSFLREAKSEKRHPALMCKNGIYAGLYNEQAKWYNR